MEKLIDRIRRQEKLFFSKKAGSFSGVPQRTVQHWSEKGLIAPVEDTQGTGKRRKYNIINCIQIAIVKALTDGRVRMSTVRGIMENLNGLGGLRLPTLLGHDEAFLIIQLKSSGANEQHHIFYEYFNVEKRPARTKTVSPIIFNSSVEKTLVVNITRIAENTLNNMG